MYTIIDRLPLYPYPPRPPSLGLKPEKKRHSPVLQQFLYNLASRIQQIIDKQFILSNYYIIKMLLINFIEISTYNTGSDWFIQV